MLDCPNCGRPVDGDSCASCGHGKTKTSKTADPFHGRCEHEDRGQRCGNPGAFSESTKGGGPWYCRMHYPPFAHRNAVTKTAPPGGFNAWRSANRVDTPKPVDFEAVVERMAIQDEKAAA